MRAQRIVSLDVQAVGSLAVGIVGALCKLLQYALVIQIVFLLLPLLYVAQKLLLLLRWVAYIEQHFVLVLQVPLKVFPDVSHKVRVYEAQEVEAILCQLRGVVWVRRPWHKVLFALNNHCCFLFSSLISILESVVLLF